MSDDTQQKIQPAREQTYDVAPVATVASGVIGTFFDELEKTESLKDKAGRLRALVLGEGVMAEPAIRAILFPDAT